MAAERRARIAGLALLSPLLSPLLALLLSAPASAQAPRATVTPAEAPVQLDLQMRLKDVKVRHTPQGDTLQVPTDDGTIELSPQEFAHALDVSQREMESSGFLYRFFNITKPWSFAWIAVGFLGQALFTFRMVLQWYASEKEKRSVIPVAFWWGSLFGGMLLFAYFVWRKDVVGIVGQSTGIFIYARNLVLIHRGTTPATN